MQFAICPMADDYNRKYLAAVIARVCQTIGWQAVQSTAMDTLVDILQHYLRRMGHLSKSYSEIDGRTESNLFDLAMVMQDMGVSLRELKTFVQEVESESLPHEVIEPSQQLVLQRAEYEEQEPPEPLFPSDTSVIQEEVDSDDSDAVLHYFPPMISRTSSDIQPEQMDFADRPLDGRADLTAAAPSSSQTDVAGAVSYTPEPASPLSRKQHVTASRLPLLEDKLIMPMAVASQYLQENYMGLQTSLSSDEDSNTDTSRAGKLSSHKAGAEGAKAALSSAAKQPADMDPPVKKQRGRPPGKSNKIPKKQPVADTSVVKVPKAKVKEGAIGTGKKRGPYKKRDKTAAKGSEPASPAVPSPLAVRLLAAAAVPDVATEPIALKIVASPLTGSASSQPIVKKKPSSLAASGKSEKKVEKEKKKKKKDKDLDKEKSAVIVPKPPIVPTVSIGTVAVEERELPSTESKPPIVLSVAKIKSKQAASAVKPPLEEVLPHFTPKEVTTKYAPDQPRDPLHSSPSFAPGQSGELGPVRAAHPPLPEHSSDNMQSDRPSSQGSLALPADHAEVLLHPSHDVPSASASHSSSQKKKKKHKHKHKHKHPTPGNSSTSTPHKKKTNPVADVSPLDMFGTSAKDSQKSGQLTPIAQVSPADLATATPTSTPKKRKHSSKKSSNPSDPATPSAKKKNPMPTDAVKVTSSDPAKKKSSMSSGAAKQSDPEKMKSSLSGDASASSDPAKKKHKKKRKHEEAGGDTSVEPAAKKKKKKKPQEKSSPAKLLLMPSSLPGSDGAVTGAASSHGSIAVRTSTPGEKLTKAASVPRAAGDTATVSSVNSIAFSPVGSPISTSGAGWPAPGQLSSTLHGKEEPETRAMDAGTAPSLQEVTPAKVPTVAGGSVDTLATSAVSATSAPGLGLPVAPVGEKVYLCPICHKPDDGGLMISCDKCNNDEWYHISCVGLQAAPTDKEKWYCPPCQKKAAKKVKKKKKEHSHRSSSGGGQAPKAKPQLPAPPVTAESAVSSSKP